MKSDSAPATLDIVNPANGAVLATVPITTADEVARHAADAQAVFDSGVWSGLAPRERAAVLLRLADLMERDAEILARLDSEDAGKPITECRDGDVPGAIETIRWFAEAADKVLGRVSNTGPDVLAFTQREPFGVVAAILPWNYPLAMACWKVGPALASGNSLHSQAGRCHAQVRASPRHARGGGGVACRSACACCLERAPSRAPRSRPIRSLARSPSPVRPRPAARCWRLPRRRTSSA